MVIMDRRNDSPNVRKGRFLWMESGERDRFVSDLKFKISQGYYYSEMIFGKIAEDLAPVMAEAVDE
jgi:hypothetical protein